MDQGTLKAQIMDARGMSRALTRIAHEVIERNEGSANVSVVGIRRRGSAIAALLADEVEKIEGARPPVAGVNDKTGFFRSARAGDVIQSVATPLHLGRSAHVWEIVHTRKADGKLLARTNLRVAMLER